MTGNAFQVMSRTPSARAGGVVVITPPIGAAVALTVAQARESQRAILSAVVTVERGGRAVVAKAKTSAARDVRRAVDVDETLRDREGGV